VKPSRLGTILLGMVLIPALGGSTSGQAPAPAGQASPLRPVTVGSPMPDFTVPAYQGGDVTLSKLRGRTVMIVFPRGMASEKGWCHVCDYQHAELVEYDTLHQWRKTAGLEILWVMPYSREKVTEWLDVYPQQLADIEHGKHPADPAKLDEAGKRRMELYRTFLPKDLKAARGRVAIPFPILVDADRTLSKGLGFFTTEWGGSKAEQNIPAVLIVDREGVLQFKYISQNTFDRPPLAHLVKVVQGLGGTRP
jgi:peroxiredoxin